MGLTVAVSCSRAGRPAARGVAVGAAGECQYRGRFVRDGAKAVLYSIAAAPGRRPKSADPHRPPGAARSAARPQEARGMGCDAKSMAEAIENQMALDLGSHAPTMVASVAAADRPPCDRSLRSRSRRPRL
jgi:hypothetical protein